MFPSGSVFDKFLYRETPAPYATLWNVFSTNSHQNCSKIKKNKWTMLNWRTLLLPILTIIITTIFTVQYWSECLLELLVDYTRKFSAIYEGSGLSPSYVPSLTICKSFTSPLINLPLFTLAVLRCQEKNFNRCILQANFGITRSSQKKVQIPSPPPRIRLQCRRLIRHFLQYGCNLTCTAI